MHVMDVVSSFFKFDKTFPCTNSFFKLLFETQSVRVS